MTAARRKSATPAAPAGDAATVARDSLAPLAAAAAKVAASKSTIPILTTLLVEASGEQVRLTATDLDRRIEFAIDAEVTAPFAACVDAARFAEAVKRFPKGGLVTFTPAGGHALKVACGRNRITLETLPVDDFPDMVLGEIDTAFELPGQLLARALDLTEHAMSDEEARYFLCGVMMGEDAEARLAFVATDGHRLARVVMDMPDDAGGLGTAIISATAVPDIARLAGDMKSDPVGLEVGAGKLRLRARGVVYTTCLVDGEYPAYQRIIPADFAASAVCQAPELGLAVERAAVAAMKDKDGRQHIRLSLAEDHIDVGARSDIADAESGIDAAWGGAPCDLGMNAGYLRDALKSLGGVEVTISVNDPGRAIMLSSDAVPDLTLIIMPVRLGPHKTDDERLNGAPAAPPPDGAEPAGDAS